MTSSWQRYAGWPPASGWAEMHVVVTAGHVDHGKSTLVRALTGQDPDRLEEERRRGLSIELGYCWTELEPVGEVAFVDVPGHERFIATTLAGMGPVPVALLVVAADDPWMPQAAEHLAALDALGVRHGVIAVTRCDLADPDPAVARTTEELARTTLRGAPVVVVSGRTGEGLGELRARLTGILGSLPPPDPLADVRLWVDRSFHVRGAGTVVTGTLPAGTVSVGDALEADGVQVRVRALEALGTPRERMTGVARVALDLGGRAPAGIARGSALLTPGAFSPTLAVDVALTGPAEVPERPVLHCGSALVGVRARPLGPGLSRLSLEQPLPLRVGDRAILRDPGSRVLWGVRVLDPMPPALRRRGAAAARGAALAAYDGSPRAELELRGIARRSRLRQLGAAVEPLPAGTVQVGDWLVAPERAAMLRDRLRDLVETVDEPLSAGVPLAEAAHRLGLPEPDLVAALVAPPLASRAGRVVSRRAADVPDHLIEAVARLEADLALSPFAAPEAARLQALGLDRAAVAALHRAGRVLRVADGVVLLPGAVDAAMERLSRLPQPFTASEARRALETTRRVALPLLAQLDAAGRTVRLPDDRRRVHGVAG